MEKEVWYRAEESTHGTGYTDEYGDWHRTGDSSVTILIRELEVLKHTPKGVWLKEYTQFSDKRFVLNEVRKGFARPTIEAALADLVARKERQAEIYEARARTARRVVALAKTGTIKAPQLVGYHRIDESFSFQMDWAAKSSPVTECLSIIQARLPLYADIGQRNALRECISSIKGAFGK